MTNKELDEAKRAIKADVNEEFDQPDADNIMYIINKYL